MANQDPSLYDANGVYTGPFHTKEDHHEDIPCGKSITTKYKDVDGKLLRQDVRIEIAEGVIASGASQL